MTDNKQSRFRGIVLRVAAWLVRLLSAGAALAGLAGAIIIASEVTHDMKATLALFPVVPPSSSSSGIPGSAGAEESASSPASIYRR